MENWLKQYVILLLQQNNIKTENIIIFFVSGEMAYTNRGRDVVGVETVHCEIQLSPQSKSFDRLVFARIFKMKEIEINQTKILQKYIGFKREDLDISESHSLIIMVDFTYDVKE